MSERIMLVDAYNVIHQIPELTEMLDISLERARGSLIRKCESWKRRRRDITRFCLVFDGKSEFIGGQKSHCGDVEVIFTRTGLIADEKILEIIRIGDYSAAQYVVVSNDNYVKRSARSLGASVMSVQEFAEECRMRGKGKYKKTQDSDDKKLSSKDKDDINKWFKEQLGI